MTPETPPQGSFCLTALKKRSHFLSEIKSRVIWSDSYSGLNHPRSESGYHESHGKGHQGFQSPPLRSARGRQRDCSSSGPLAESGSSAPLQRPTGIWSGAFFLRAALRRHAFRNFHPSNRLYKKPSVRCLTKLPELRLLRDEKKGGLPAESSPCHPVSPSGCRSVSERRPSAHRSAVRDSPDRP